MPRTLGEQAPASNRKRRGRLTDPSLST